MNRLTVTLGQNPSSLTVVQRVFNHSAQAEFHRKTCSAMVEQGRNTAIQKSANMNDLIKDLCTLQSDFGAFCEQWTPSSHRRQQPHQT